MIDTFPQNKSYSKLDRYKRTLPRRQLQIWLEKEFVTKIINEDL